MTQEDVILVDIFDDVVNSMVVTGINKVYYEPGRSFQILEQLSLKDNSISMKGQKYPLIAVQFPVREARGSGIYGLVTIPRIVIANINTDGLKSVKDRYKTGGPFKSILYPCYYEFLKRLAWHPNVNGQDPNFLIHTKMDNPGEQPIGEGLSDWIDSIEILNLEITLNQIKNCK